MPSTNLEIAPNHTIIYLDHLVAEIHSRRPSTATADTTKSQYKKVKEWIGQFTHDTVFIKYLCSALSNMGFALITEFLAGHMTKTDLYIGMGTATLTIPYVVVKTLFEIKEHGISIKENKINGVKVTGMELLKKSATLAVVCGIAIAVGYIDIPGLTYVLPSLFGMATSYFLDKIDQAYGVLSHFGKHHANGDVEQGMDHQTIDLSCEIIEALFVAIKAIRETKSVATTTRNTQNLDGQIEKLENKLKETLNKIYDLSPIIREFKQRKNELSGADAAATDKIIGYLETIQSERSNQNQDTLTGQTIYTVNETQATTSRNNRPPSAPRNQGNNSNKNDDCKVVLNPTKLNVLFQKNSHEGNQSTGRNLKHKF